MGFYECGVGFGDFSCLAEFFRFCGKVDFAVVSVIACVQNYSVPFQNPRDCVLRRKNVAFFDVAFRAAQNEIPKFIFLYKAPGNKMVNMDFCAEFFFRSKSSYIPQIQKKECCGRFQAASFPAAKAQVLKEDETAHSPR